MFKKVIKKSAYGSGSGLSLWAPPTSATSFMKSYLTQRSQLVAHNHINHIFCP